VRINPASAVAVIVVLLHAVMAAQQPIGSVFGGVLGGGSPGVLSIGGGVEAPLDKQTGISGEFTIWKPFGSPSLAAYLGSGALVHHFQPSADGHSNAFMLGGYSVPLNGQGLGLFEVGGGAMAWKSRHLGVRSDIRAHFLPICPYCFMVEFHVGVMLR